MKFTKRDMKLIEYLKNYEFVDLSSMAEYFEMSLKSLKNQLKDLAETIQKYGIFLNFMPGNQIKIDGGDNFPDMISMSLPRFEMDYEEKFLLLLVLNNDFLIIQDVADRLLVSKSYAEKQLPLIVKKYPGDIQTLRHYGIRYVAPQMKRRETFVRIMFPYIFGEDYSFALRQFHQLHFPILDYFSEEQISYARNVSGSLLDMKWFRITDESAQIVFLYILFLIRSVDAGDREELDDSEKQQEEFIPVREFEGLYEWLRDRVRKWKLSESEMEVQHLYKMLLSLQKQDIFYREQLVAKMQSPVDAILKGVYERIGIDLSQDGELFRDLAGHLYATVFREKSLKPSSDSYGIQSLKRQYPLGFDMAAVAVDYMKDMYRFTVTNSDVVSLALHFQAAVERLKGKRENPKVIVICHMGKAAGSIICSKLRRKIGDIDVLGNYSLQEFLTGKIPECDYDYIVATERIIRTKIPVIYVSLALPEAEIEKVAEIVRKMQTYHYLERISVESMILHIDETDIMKIIEKMLEPLITKHLVGEAYMQSVLERESVSSTNLRYVALPHGNPAFVKSTQLIIGRLNQPVLWDDENVCCVFLLAASPRLLKEQMPVYDAFYRTFSNPDVEERIKKLQRQNLSDETFKQMLFHILR